MRVLIALLVMVYLVGVGVVLAPVVEGGWNSETASAFMTTLAQALPDALTWPVRLVHARAGG
jgi:hypothetical protein